MLATAERSLLSQSGVTDADRGDPLHHLGLTFAVRPDIRARLLERVTGEPGARTEAVKYHVPFVVKDNAALPLVFSDIAMDFQTAEGKKGQLLVEVCIHPAGEDFVRKLNCLAAAAPKAHLMALLREVPTEAEAEQLEATGATVLLLGQEFEHYCRSEQDRPVRSATLEAI